MKSLNNVGIVMIINAVLMCIFYNYSICILFFSIFAIAFAIILFNVVLELGDDLDANRY